MDIKFARDVQILICRHQTSLVIYGSYTKKELLIPIETIYASYLVLPIIIKDAGGAEGIAIGCEQ